MPNQGGKSAESSTPSTPGTGASSSESDVSTSTEAEESGTERTDAETRDEKDQTEKPGEGDRTFTQAEVDQLVQSEVSRIVRKKAEELYRRRVGDLDIDALKAKAGESSTLEERVAAMERRATEAEAAALRSRIANEFHVSAEDAELFLTGTEEDVLVAQAKRLAERDNERKQRGPQVPNEGRTPKSSNKADETREFADFLTGRRS